MLIGLCGFARAGKDTVAKGLVERYGFTRFAFADALRREVEEIYSVPSPGDTRKDAKLLDGFSYRDLLLKHGRERRTADPDYWIAALERAVCQPPTPANIVVTDCRLAREIDWVRENDGYLVWVHRFDLSSNGDDTERDWSAACDVLLHNDFSAPDQLAASLIGTVRSLGYAA